MDLRTCQCIFYVYDMVKQSIVFDNLFRKSRTDIKGSSSCCRADASTPKKCGSPRSAGKATTEVGLGTACDLINKPAPVHDPVCDTLNYIHICM